MIIEDILIKRQATRKVNALETKVSQISGQHTCKSTLFLMDDNTKALHAYERTKKVMLLIYLIYNLKLHHFR